MILMVSVGGLVCMLWVIVRQSVMKISLILYLRPYLQNILDINTSVNQGLQHLLEPLIGDCFLDKVASRIPFHTI